MHLLIDVFVCLRFGKRRPFRIINLIFRGVYAVVVLVNTGDTHLGNSFIGQMGCDPGNELEECWDGNGLA